MNILHTGPSSLTLQAEVNFTNPTQYSATVPYVNINILVNGTVLGQATAKNVAVVPGPNKNIIIEALWDPLTSSGKKGAAVGRELLSQYGSGKHELDSSYISQKLKTCPRLQHDPNPKTAQRHHPRATRPRPCPRQSLNLAAHAQTPLA